VIIAQARLHEEGATYQHDLSFSSQQEIRYRAPSGAGRSGAGCEVRFLTRPMPAAVGGPTRVPQLLGRLVT
jgi:hypothetical protein